MGHQHILRRNSLHTRTTSEDYSVQTPFSREQFGSLSTADVYSRVVACGEVVYTAEGSANGKVSLVTVFPGSWVLVSINTARLQMGC